MNSSSGGPLLVVFRRVKQHAIKNGGIRSSLEIPDALSELVRETLDEAIMYAKADGRTTVMGRDIKSVLNNTKTKEK